VGREPLPALRRASVIGSSREFADRMAHLRCQVMGDCEAMVHDREQLIHAFGVEYVGAGRRGLREVERAMRDVTRVGARTHGCRGDEARGIAQREALGATYQRSMGVDRAATIGLEHRTAWRGSTAGFALLLEQQVALRGPHVVRCLPRGLP
jgi:hypothetical protein